MKKKYLLFLYIIFTFSVQTYAQLTSLNEDFNSTCPAGDHSPGNWHIFNSIPSTMPLGEWTCDPSYGRSGSPGISCTGYYGSPTATTHVDTSLLISPQLDLSGYSGTIYVNFDTKTTKFALGAKLQILVSDTTAFDSTGGDSTFTVAERNIFDATDSADWVTHQADLTPYKNLSHFYIGFRFISAISTTTASRWYLDNIHTTTAYLSVSNLQDKTQSISILGNSSPDMISVSCNASASGTYDLALYDLVGRRLYYERVNVVAGNNTFHIKDLRLPGGMYIVKMASESWSGAAKAIVH